MALKKTSDVICMVVDNSGLFLEYALRLARDFKKVYYHLFNEDSAPMPQPSYIGYGMDEIEVVHSYHGDHFDAVDLICYPSVGLGYYQWEAQHKYGKATWGTGLAEELELNREKAIGVFKEIGLPTAPSKPVVGVDALRKYLVDHKEVYIKVSKWRGLIETFRSFNIKNSDLILDAVAYKLGPLKTVIPFLVEERLKDKVEIGTDPSVVDGKYAKFVSCGLEIKNRGYFTKIREYKNIPKPLQEVNDKLAPVLKDYDMRGDFCTEVRVGKDGKPYLIDLTMRQGVPPGELLQEMDTNIAERVWQGANGVLVDMKPVAKYGIEIMMTSERLLFKEPQAIYFPEEHRKNIKLHSCVKIDGTYTVLPLDYDGDETAGAVVGWGSSIDDAAKMVKEAAKSIEGQSLEIDVKNIVQEIEEELEKADKMGMSMV
ncbi:MAG: hypothetical protein PHE17_18150 [Thiothrix sp.]|uniref:hypothetical protein n=1 Tax=Thiothrix sp. TaxID=1032 RepID=UPI00262E19F7|nr:hypothetical protein [Thiothrix sp.]MDD5394944.1 hypothetical protein [Thiothrix sp.]